MAAENLSTSIVKDFYDYISDLMRVEGISKTDLARHLGVTRAYVSLLLSRKPEPSRELISKLASAFRMAEETLLSFFVVDDWALRKGTDPQMAVLHLREKAREKPPTNHTWISVPMSPGMAREKMRLHAAKQVLDRKATRLMDGSRIELVDKITRLTDEQVRAISELASVFLHK